jgi:hypothetical protein
MADLSELSPAAVHFGEALCPPGDTDCVYRVGRGWEQAIEARFGGLQSVPPAVQKMDLVGNGGRRIGSLTMVDRTVTLCFERGNGGGQMCGVVGVGNEALETAQAMLALQGISVRPAG